MKSKYKYHIQQDDGKYYFMLMPNNNSAQPIAISDGFDSEDQAVEALMNFKLAMKQHLYDESFVIREEDKKYSFHLFSKDNRLVLKSARGGVEVRINCLKQIENVKKNYDADLID